MDRFARQRRLAAVGDAGQARIAAATYAVSAEPLGDPSSTEPTNTSRNSVAGGALSHRVERDYLERAGARHFALRVGRATPFVHEAIFEYAEAREQAAGAWHALMQLRAALAGAAPLDTASSQAEGN